MPPSGWRLPDVKVGSNCCLAVSDPVDSRCWVFMVFDLLCSRRRAPQLCECHKNCGIDQGPLARGFIGFANGLEAHGEAVIAAFTIILAISTIGLWSSTHALFKAGERQIELARISADAALKSANVSERSLIDVQRALIVPTRFQIDTLIGDRKNIIGYRIKRYIGEYRRDSGSKIYWHQQHPCPDRRIA